MFMPLGLGAVSALTGHGEEYVAWGWAVNGFASVIGSVLTTIIAMIFGFNVVLALAMVTYLVALVALRRLQRPMAAAASPRLRAGPVRPATRSPSPPRKVAVGAGPAAPGRWGRRRPDRGAGLRS